MVSSRGIVGGENELCNFLAERASSSSKLYLAVYAAMARTALYLGGGKNYIYVEPIRLGFICTFSIVSTRLLIKLTNGLFV